MPGNDVEVTAIYKDISSDPTPTPIPTPTPHPTPTLEPDRTPTPTPVDPNVPQTGDHNDVALIILVLGAGVALLVAALFWRGKSKQAV